MLFFRSKVKNIFQIKNLIKSPNWQVADKLYFTSTVEQSVNLGLAGKKIQHVERSTNSIRQDFEYEALTTRLLCPFYF